MTRPLHLAILMCGTPVEAVRAEFGTYGDIFEQRLLQGLEARGKDAPRLDLKITKWNVFAFSEYPNIDNVDALLLTEAPDTAFHDDPWIISLTGYISKVLQNSNKAVFGVCFGHQLIARAAGGKIGVNPGGLEISLSPFDLSNEGKKLFGTDTLSLHQMHRDAVLEVPNDFINIGSSPTCAVQGMYRRGRLLTFQAHPEFTPFIMEQIIRVRAAGVYDERVVQDASARAVKPHDGARVFAAMLDILAELQISLEKQ